MPEQIAPRPRASSRSFVEGRRPREADRPSSTGLVAASFASGVVVVNLLDTPGNPDFVAFAGAVATAALAAGGRYGVTNAGYNTGFAVTRGATYDFSVWARSDVAQDVTEHV